MIVMTSAIGPWILGVTLACVAACGDDGAAVLTASEASVGTSGAPATGEPTGEPPTTSEPTPTTGRPEPGTGTTASATGGESTGATSEAGSTDGDEAGTSGAPGTSGGVDTDGADDTGTSGDPDLPPCPLAALHTPCDVISDDPLHAMGLGCSSLGPDYLDKENAVAITKLEFKAAGEQGGKRPWQVARAYGSYLDPGTQKPFWAPREGEKLLLISSGLLPAPDAAGAVVIPGSAVYNDVGGAPWDDDLLPPPMSPEPGSPDPKGFKDCDGEGDCSNTLQAQWELGGGDPNDRMWFSFEVTAPSIAAGDLADANGYNFMFAFFSAEFPEWVDTNFNDIFVVWQDSLDYTGNITFIDGQPLTVTALWPIDYQGQCELLDPQCSGEDEHLDGTGYRQDGGATGWYLASGGVQPGETFRLAFAILDMGDSTYDTTAILDAWQWDCEGCVPNERDSCGVRPQ